MPTYLYLMGDDSTKAITFVSTRTTRVATTKVGLCTQTPFRYLVVGIVRTQRSGAGGRATQLDVFDNVEKQLWIGVALLAGQRSGYPAKMAGGAQ